MRAFIDTTIPLLGTRWDATWIFALCFLFVFQHMCAVSHGNDGDTPPTHVFIYKCPEQEQLGKNDFSHAGRRKRLTRKRLTTTAMTGGGWLSLQASLLMGSGLSATAHIHANSRALIFWVRWRERAEHGGGLVYCFWVPAACLFFLFFFFTFLSCFCFLCDIKEAMPCLTMANWGADGTLSRSVAFVS